MAFPCQGYEPLPLAGGGNAQNSSHGRSQRHTNTTRAYQNFYDKGQDSGGFCLHRTNNTR
jgi:hypothetical protein